jgi:hypothetical protein
MMNLLLVLCTVFALNALVVPAAQSGVRTSQPLPDTVRYRTQQAPGVRWKIDSVLLALGDENDSSLHAIFDVKRDARGGLVIAADAGITLLSSRRERTRMGRVGRGPGEFTGGLVALWINGDTLRAMGGDGRIERFHLQTGFVRSEGRIPSGDGSTITPVGFLADGSAIIQKRPAASSYPADNRFVSIAKLYRRKPDGSEALIGTLQRQALARTRDGRTRRVVFGGSGEAATFPTGFCTAFSTSFAFGCYDGQGKRIAAVLVSGRIGRQITDVDRQVVFEANDRANPGPEGAPQRDAMRRNAVFAERLPSIGRMLLSSTGEVWLGPADASDETVLAAVSPSKALAWSVFSREGRWLSEVSVPAGLFLTAVGQDWVAGIEEDPNGFQRAVIRSLRRR